MLSLSSSLKTFFSFIGRGITYECGADDFSVLPFYWRYTEIKHKAKSQPGNIQYINGTVGKLYLKGVWQNFLPFLILGSEIHAGAKLANAQGYYRILHEASFPLRGYIPFIEDEIRRLGS